MSEARAPQKSLPKINPVDRPFWEGARNNKFLLQKCKSCGKVQFFPRIACVDCFGEVDWFEAKGTGKIHSFTLVRVPRNPERLAPVWPRSSAIAPMPQDWRRRRSWASLPRHFRRAITPIA